MSGARQVRLDGDDGISLIEVIVALFIIGVVMTSSAVFFINGLKNNSLQSQRQSAVAIADQALEAVQAVQPKKLLAGRTQAEANALVKTDTDAGGTLTAQDVIATDNYDASAVASSADTIPTQRTQTVGGIDYLVRTFIDICYLSTATPQTCTRTSTTGSTAVYRATIAVTWTPKTVSCAGGCRYIASVLIDKQSDPKFNTNVSTPAITSVTPASALINTTPTLTINGSGFVAGAVVRVSTGGGAMGSTLTNTGTQITVVWNVGTTAGSYTLTVSNPDSGSVNYTVSATPPPGNMTSSPSSIRNAVSTTVTLTGTGFQSGVQISLTSGTVTNAVYTSSTSVTVTLTPSGLQTGSATVTFTNPDGGTGSATVTLLTSQPVITGGSQGAVGQVGQPTTVTLTGSVFVPGATVTVPTGSGSVSSTVVNSSTSVTVTYVPSATSQSPTFTLTNPDGGTTNRAVTVTATQVALTITGVSPTTVPRNSSVTFTMTGTGFSGPVSVTATAQGVSFDATNETVVNAGRVTFLVATPNYGPLTTDVVFTITNSDGRTASKTVTVTIQ